MPSLRLWRRSKATHNESMEIDQTAPTTRPYLPSGGMLDGDEKTPIPTGRVAVPRPVAVRPRVDPRFSAYSTPADYKSKDEMVGDSRRFRAGTFDSLDTPISPDSVISADSPVIDRGAKWKEDGVDDPEAERRRKKAEAARRKAEEEEQERLDFFQML